MSFYRNLVTAVAVFSLSASVLATQNGTDMQSNPNASTMTTDTMQTSQINVNTATSKELMKIKGLTAAKARAIVSYRKKHGNFTDLDQLKNVRSLKRLNDDQLKNIQDQLTL